MSAAPLWTSAAMVEAMRASINGALPDAVTGLSIDSRTIAPGEAYFAIKGEVHDGHDFVAAALKAGAALAVIETAQRGKFAPPAVRRSIGERAEQTAALGRLERLPRERQIDGVQWERRPPQLEGGRVDCAGNIDMARGSRTAAA